MLTKFLKRTVDERDVTFKLEKKISSQVEFNQSDVALDSKEILEANTISTSNLTLSGNQTINGLTTIDGSVVLVNAQTDPKNNGLYYTDSSSWSRVTNDLNDVKLIKIIDGDYNSYFYTLLDEPVEIGIDNIVYSQLYQPNQLGVYETILTFNTADLNTGSGSYFELMAGVSGKSILVLGCLLKTSLTGATCSAPAIIVYENGSSLLFTLSGALLAGTGATNSEILKYDGASYNSFNVGDGIGFNHPALTATGTISGTIYLTYRLI